MDKKKNIKIVTMNAAYNYGAMLQAYALQEILKFLSYYPEFIDQRELFSHRNKKDIKYFIRSFFSLFFEKQVALGRSRFDDFINQYQTISSDKYGSYEEMQKNPPKADVFLSGSDQVWNPTTIKPINFLEFVKDGTKKVSYAASLGVSKIPEHNKDQFKLLINEFDHISVREEQGRDVIKELTDKNIEVHLDPVFLLKKEDWSKLSSEVPEVDYPYILCYILYRPSWLNEYLKKIHNKTGLKIVVIDNSPFRNIFHHKMVRNAGPREFLWLIENAENVITSSFHGTAFATLFNKPFYAAVNPNAPSRISNLLNKLNLNNRILETGNNIDFEDVSFIDANKVISEERQRSQIYLLESIG